MNDAERIPMILAKLDHVGEAVVRVEKLIEKEIADLKADNNKMIDRLADDQRRLWEAVRSLENDRNKAHGGGKVMAGMITSVISILGSSAAAVFITKFLK
jgi:hypothetical protein